MSEVTRRVYEITEDLRRDLLSGKLTETRSEELDKLYEELSRYYEKNLDKIALDIKEKGVKTQYWGSISIFNPVEFSKKAVLYTDVLLLEDKLEDVISSRELYKQEELVLELRKVARMFDELKPLVENDMLVLFPNASKWENVDKNSLKKVSEKDAEIIREGFTETKREFTTKLVKTTYSPEVIKEFGGLESFVSKGFLIGGALQINTSLMSSKFFDSELVTDADLGWDDFNAVINRRRSITRTPVAAQALGLMNLPLLQGIDLETILDVREKHADVFETWRDGWRNACLGLEGITDPAEFNEELGRIRSDVINPNLEKLDKWRDVVRPLGGAFRGLGVASILTGAYFGNLPSGRLAQAFGGLIVTYGKKTAEWLVDNVMRRNFVYFLWRAKEAS